MIINILIFVAGFIVGALVARKNLDEVNKVVFEAKQLAAKAEAEAEFLREKLKNTREQLDTASKKKRFFFF